MIARYLSCPAVSQIWAGSTHNQQADELRQRWTRHTFDRLRVHLDALGGELHADGSLGLQVKLVAGEAGKQVRFPDTGVSDQHNCSGAALRQRTLRKTASNNMLTFK